jgi:glycosyltransferase involved in cell wall biosynthesis
MPFKTMTKIAVVSSFMPPHLGGLEVAANTIFDAYRENGYKTRWMASRVPENMPRCVNDVIRGVPWPVWGPSGVRALARLIRWADVIHVHDCLYFSSAVAAVIARRLKKPLIVSQHIGFVNYPSRFLNALERTAYATVGRAVFWAEDVGTQVLYLTELTRNVFGPLQNLSDWLFAENGTFPNPKRLCCLRGG